MAKDAKPAAEGAEAPPKKSKKLLIIILAVVLVLVIAGGAGAYFFLKSNADHAEDEEVAEETAKPAKKKEKDKKKDAHPPVFVGLEAFTVNLVPETGDQYLQVVISLELEDAEAQAALTNLMPKIRNNLTLLLSSKKASELHPKDGKEKLAMDIRDEINNLINPPTKNRKGEIVPSETPVLAVLFTSFIIQ
ncbi:MAG: flagellar basal body-associated FliL family protein [Azonexus sp.]|nr:flagellar basal body-associated FliL family protein [Azonexus sp.]